MCLWQYSLMSRQTDRQGAEAQTQEEGDKQQKLRDTEREGDRKSQGSREDK